MYIMKKLKLKLNSNLSRLRASIALLAVLGGHSAYGQMVELATCLVTTSTTYGPMNTSASASATGRYATIYPASQLSGIANKDISSVYYRKGGATNISGTPNFKIYLKATTDTDLGSAAADWATLITGATLVYDSNPVAATAGASGWKEFALSNNFLYDGTSNLMVLTEYVNTGNTTSNTWYYEYGSPCISTSNNNTSKYVTTTTGTPGASLSTANYRRPQIAFDYYVSCKWPSAVQVTGATLNTLSVSWVAPNNVPADGYELYYSSTNVAPTNATVPNVTGITGTSTTISNLVGDTTYYVWVRSKCSATDVSDWSAVAQGVTGYCIPASTATYYVKSIATTGALSDINYTASSYQSYVNNTSQTFAMLPNSTVTVNMTPSSGNNYYYMWVDWNNDLDFDDAGETIFATTSYTSNYSGTLTIPANITSGQYRVRFANSYIGAAVPCGPSTYGNHVDYTLQIITPTCWSPSNLSSTSVTHQSATIDWVAPATAPAMGYELYYSTSNTTPTVTTAGQYTNISGTSQAVSGLQPSTTYYVWVRGVCSSTDQSVWSLFHEFRTLCEPPVITVTGQTICPNNTATLTATSTTQNATYNWYADATSTTPLATGSSFTTPVLTTTTTYYASAKSEVSGYVGKDAPTVTTGNTGFSNLGLIFDALQNMTIETVDFYPYHASASSSTVTINLLSSSGAVLQSKQITVPVTSQGVLNVLPLGFEVPAGTGYKLVVAGVTNSIGALRENVAAQINFPYSLTGLCNITGTTTSGYYYYLYNWKVSSGCESPRQPVTATVDTNCLSTSEVTAKNDVKVYPNPFVDVVNISNADEVKSIAVVDAAGRLVKTIEKVSSQISLGDLKSGMYILNLNKKDGSKESIKMIKK